MSSSNKAVPASPQKFRVSATKTHGKDGQLVWKLRLRNVQQPRCLLMLIGTLLKATDQAIERTEYHGMALFIYTKKTVAGDKQWRLDQQQITREQLTPIVDIASKWNAENPRTRPNQATIDLLVRRITKPGSTSKAPLHVADHTVAKHDKQDTSPAALRKTRQKKLDRINARRTARHTRENALATQEAFRDADPAIPPVILTSRTPAIA